MLLPRKSTHRRKSDYDAMGLLISCIFLFWPWAYIEFIRVARAVLLGLTRFLPYYLKRFPIEGNNFACVENNTRREQYQAAECTQPSDECGNNALQSSIPSTTSLQFDTSSALLLIAGFRSLGLPHLSVVCLGEN